MEIKNEYLRKYMHAIAIDQLHDDYIKKGYQVSKEGQIGNYNADLLAIKGDEHIVLEIKVNRLDPRQREKIAAISNFVNEHENYRFLLVVATPPKEKKIEIEEVENVLFNYFLEEMPDELDELSSHTRIDDVTDVVEEEILIEKGLIKVKGSGIINVTLQFGSNLDLDSGYGYENEHLIPFNFQIDFEYDNKLEVSSINDLKFDVSDI